VGVLNLVTSVFFFLGEFLTQKNLVGSVQRVFLEKNVLKLPYFEGKTIEFFGCIFIFVRFLRRLIDLQKQV
jgi:hypothetical protein